MNISFLLFYLFFGLILCFLLISLLLFFICYECLILLLFFILFLFIPTYYRIRTAFFFFLFSIFGSISFILSLLIFVLSEWLISCLLIVFIFFIKIPCFPFFYWLPEVHCEVDSSISLWLAGLLLKLGLFGILRFILCSFFLGCRFLCSFVLSISLIGVLIVSCSCFRFFDLKKIIAFSSILHLNLTLVSIYSLNSIGVLSGIITSISHGFSSVGLFLFAGLLINKTYSRYLDSFFFIDSIFREVLIFFLLANLSFPGSFNLVSEILALINIVWNNSFFCFSFLVAGLFSCYYWFLILNRKLPYHCCSSSLNWIEWFLFFWLLVLIYFLGFLLILSFNSNFSSGILNELFIFPIFISGQPIFPFLITFLLQTLKHLIMSLLNVFFFLILIFYSHYLDWMHDWYDDWSKASIKVLFMLWTIFLYSLCYYAWVFLWD